MIAVFILFLSSLFCYEDPELTALWQSISNLHAPTVEDYKKIETYLKEGKRPYLDILRKCEVKNEGRLERIYDFKLLGPEGELPIVVKRSVKLKEHTKQRCILVFASYNSAYADKAWQLMADIESCGYSGNVWMRIGGYPNLENDGIKICHVPYAFKVAFLKEAQLAGYKEVLWLDTAIHPLTDLETIFESIQLNGYYFTTVCTLKENHPFHLAIPSNAMGISTDLHNQIPHLSSGIIGLNMTNDKALKLLSDWHKETEKVIPCMNWFPEELSLSIVAWKLGIVPSHNFGDIVCSEREMIEATPFLPRAGLQFFLDELR